MWIAISLMVFAAAACSSKADKVAPPTIEPARAAQSPPAATPPAGEIRELPGRPVAAVFDPGIASLVVLEPDRLVLLGDTGPARTIEVPGEFTALVTAGSGAAGSGTAYLAGKGGYLRVDLRAGTSERVEVADAEFTAIAVRANGGLVLGSASGAVYLLGPDGTTVDHEVGIFARVDDLATVGDTTVVLDRGQTSVTTVTDDGRAQHALRAGEGATTLVTDAAGRALVADTRGDGLLVFGVDPLIMRQRYPVPAAPYGLTGSQNLTWVSQTATNEVVGYDLATGIPVEKVRYPTVRQPDFLAFDDATGALFVVSGSGAGVQVITSAAGPK
jgi:hypothetical protein